MKLITIEEHFISTAVNNAYTKLKTQDATPEEKIRHNLSPILSLKTTVLLKSVKNAWLIWIKAGLMSKSLAMATITRWTCQQNTRSP